MMKLVSWNVCGFELSKRHRIFAKLKELKADIVFLQETHMTFEDDHLTSMCIKWNWNCIVLGPSNKAGRLMVLAKEQIKEVEQDSGKTWLSA
jgi:exonuclease III